MAQRIGCTSLLEAEQTLAGSSSAAPDHLGPPLERCWRPTAIIMALFMLMAETDCDAHYHDC